MTGQQCNLQRSGGREIRAVQAGSGQGDASRLVCRLILQRRDVAGLFMATLPSMRIGEPEVIDHVHQRRSSSVFAGFWVSGFNLIS